MAGRNKKRRDRGNDRRFTNTKYSKRMMGIATKISIGTLVSIVIILLAYMYNKYKLQHASNVLEETLSGLLREENSAKVTPGTKVALGFGSCQDIIVQSNQVVFDRPPKYPEHHFSISNKEEFLEVFSYFYQHGAAAERFVSNSTFFGELVRLAEKAPSARYIIGGNAPVMAKRFVKEGVEQVLLGAQMSRSLETQFPKNIKISGPFVDEDDVHLLLEYPAGQRWGSFIPVRANRYIIEMFSFRVCNSYKYHVIFLSFV
ncbi:unnamed protein product [Larinioides sclopetarius]|uniref:Uncharacterized protein n=1 Tax=Larinioides sclopetarius TaxID=280406 RepID=A0AAV2B9W9_9ARAC